MSRPITTIIDVVKQQIPLDFKDYEVLVKSLDSIKDSAQYTAPEVMHTRWNQLAWALSDHLGEPDRNLQWQVNIEGILLGKLDYKDYL